MIIHPLIRGLDEIIYIAPTELILFVRELNKLGNRGYRLEQTAKIPLATESTVTDLLVFGIVKFVAGEKYEYNYIAASSPKEIGTRANHQTENGFYFGRKWCLFPAGVEKIQKQRKGNYGSGSFGDLAHLSLGVNGSVFIFERKVAVIKKNVYRVLDGAAERGEKTLAKNQAIMDGHVSRGSPPVQVFYLGRFDLFNVIMEKG